jgi:DNA-binding response OmpR family regulator
VVALDQQRLEGGQFMVTRILLVEDDPDTIEIIQLYLENEGYEVNVATDGLEALRQSKVLNPDLVLLDLMLPKVDGMEVCRLIRKESWTPIIMLTARVEEDSRLSGLDLGADDYISKPFSPKEVVARVKAVLRRTNPPLLDTTAQQISCGGISLDLKEYEVKVNGEPVWLTPTELKLLSMFLREPGRVFTREQIIERVFGREFYSFDRSVDTHISNLRRKLNANSQESQYIQTIYGVGYKLNHD